MCSYDKLLHEANEKGLLIVEKDFKSDAKGLCKGNKIGIRKDLSSNEKACVLAEEIGHYETTVGDIISQNSSDNRKKEKMARKWAVDKMLTIEDLFLAGENSCETLFDVAEYLEVTEDFLSEAIAIFKQKYGHSLIGSNDDNKRNKEKSNGFQTWNFGKMFLQQIKRKNIFYISGS